MSKSFLLKGQVQNYAWGGKTYIPSLLNIENDKEKYAEYWLGAHVNAPAQLNLDGQAKVLDAYISEMKSEVLGEEIYSRFGRLPYLFKVLDVNDMLSIQVHPTKVEAEKGFARENEAGIAISAKDRNYKDDNHKPEIMVALSEFWLLHGFLPEVELLQVLGTTPELKYLIEVYKDGGYKGLYQHVMEESAERTNEVLRPLVDRILPHYKEGKLKKESADYWAARAFLTFCSEGDLDKGIYSIYFFNIVKVLPGQAVFQDAGIPHAYMEGQNMELMANSDNVLRGGLTPKHVDVAELLKHVAFEETIPNILEGELQADGLERIYFSPAPDFELSKIELNSEGSYQKTAATVEILIVLEGAVEVREGDNTLTLKRGEALFVSAGGQYQITAGDAAILYKASAPVQN